MKRYEQHPFMELSHAVKGKVKFTEWLIIPLEEPIISFTASEAWYSNFKYFRNLIKSYPESKDIFDEQGRVVANVIPLFSTFKGWRWNRDQIFHCMNTYPGITLRAFRCYFDSIWSNAILRKVFGKHFRQFIRESNTLGMFKNLTRFDPETFSEFPAKVPIYNPTLQKLSYKVESDLRLEVQKALTHMVYPGLFVIKGMNFGFISSRPATELDPNMFWRGPEVDMIIKLGEFVKGGSNNEKSKV